MSLSRMLMMVAKKTATFSIPGVSTNSSTSTISVPSGAAAGDMLVLLLTNGSQSSMDLPSGFTSLTSTAAGAAGYRVMQSGDSSFTLAATYYATLVAVRKSTGSIAFDQFASTSYTSNTTFQTPTITPSTADEVSIMAFLDSFGSLTSAPGYTNLISYSVSGTGACGMGVSWTQLTSNAAFAGTSCNGTEPTSTYPAVALQILFK